MPSAEYSFRNILIIPLQTWFVIRWCVARRGADHLARSESAPTSTANFPRGYLMSYADCLLTFAMLAGLAAIGSTSTSAQEVKTVFVIAMENHNWTQPANQFTGGIQQIYQNPNAPFVNALVNGTAVEIIDGAEVNISSQVSYATAYHNVLSTPNGNNPHIHPSEPNYIWAEAGTTSACLTTMILIPAERTRTPLCTSAIC